MPIARANRTTGVFSQSSFDRRGLPSTASLPAFVQGVSIGGPTSIKGDDNYVRSLQFGVTKSIDEGSPNSPSLQLTQVGMWKFRWVVKPGQRRISIRVKQIRSFTGMRPTMTIKANANVGLTSDNVVVAPDGLDWVVMEFVFTATGTDVVFVELRNNLYIEGYPTYFDHIIVT
jgi:hypothetical protein